MGNEPINMSEFLLGQAAAAEGLQNDLDFWRKKLMQDHAEISYYQAQAESHLARINETKRNACQQGIELK